MKHLPALLSIIFLSLLISCRKYHRLQPLPDPALRFFSLPAGAHPAVYRAATALQLANAQAPFAAALAVKSGFPQWNKVQVQYDATTRGSDTILLVPLVPDGSPRVHAVIELRMSDAVVMRVLSANDYKNYPYGSLTGSNTTAERFAVELMKIEHLVFGYNQFVLRDDSLLKFNRPQAAGLHRYLKLNLIPVTDSAALVLAQSDCYEVEVWYDPDGDSDPDHNSGNEYFTGETYLEGNCNSSGGGYPGGFGIFSGGSPVVVSGWTTNAPPVGSGPGWTNWPVYHPPQGWTPSYVADADCPPLINELQQDTAFISKLRELNDRSVTNLSYERGYDVRRRDIGLYLPLNGTPNAGLINWHIPFPTDGLMHCHYRGLNSIFSPQDMVLMAQLWLHGLARDSSRFFFVVTSADAYPYLVVVNDVAKYRAFAERITKDSTENRRFMRVYDSKFNFQDIEKNEKGFLQMLLKETKGGLTLFRANESCDKWNKLGIDAWGTMSTTDCY
jgi:hypothetical protein